MRKLITVIISIALAVSMTACASVSYTVSKPEEDAKAESAADVTSSEDIEDDTQKNEKEQPGTKNDAAENDADENQGDIPALRDSIASSDGLGENAICGACIGSMGIHDQQLTDLAKKHFNALTLENELKMDAMFGYSNDAPKNGSIHDEELNGEVIAVPELDHSRADAILDMIAAWNAENPERAIRVRGHVLVWHSQAPEWFFHEGYDKNNDYVSKEEMDRRLEWYIKSMLEYYTGDDSKYKGMFYGWDVVNEAVSDRGGNYRSDIEQGSDSLTDSTHGTKSSWWKVYGSNEFIINAFRYANKYAPADLDLYYNDYNECDKTKRRGIITLINDVKSAEGTRLDGFGMQGHYSVNAPTAEQIEEAAREYAEAAGKIMITELDVKPSMFYDGTSEKLPEEFMRQGRYYLAIYDTMKALRQDGIDVQGITFWGIVDTFSWLQGQNPLLFDGSYNAKPAYWAFVDPSVLDDDKTD
ncbi:MAG: endo-1,4-beta-xylanase [Lachnospiraceae bacterium]|nr:endo-1,4-beta-xylanase [Lachnospiraceae bacterium]